MPPLLLSLIVPKPIYNIFWGKRSTKKKVWQDPGLRGPEPVTSIAILHRIPLTRPGSPNLIGKNENDEIPRLMTKPSISTPLHESDSSSQIGNISATVSTLLNGLPLELRQKIWGEVLGGRIFHFVLVGKDDLIPSPLLRSIQWPSLNADCNGLKGYLDSRAMELEMPTEREQLLPLLLTCKQIYSESIDIVYSSNTFFTEDADVMEFLPRLLLPQRINAITSLCFIWDFRRWPPLGPMLQFPEEWRESLEIRHASWESTWNMFSKMQNIRKLHVKLKVHSIWWNSFNDESSKALLGPIRRVTGVKDFVISLPFPPDVGGSRVRGNNSWSRTEARDVDQWDTLPCKIRRVDNASQL